MTNKKPIKLLAPTVRELTSALQQLPPDAIITESEAGNYIGINIQHEQHHWDDDGYGNPVDYEIAKFDFYSLDEDY